MKIVERVVTYAVCNPSGCATGKAITCNEFGDDWQYNASEIINALHEQGFVPTTDILDYYFEELITGVEVYDSRTGVEICALQELWWFRKEVDYEA